METRESLAVVDRSGNALVGTIDEKMRAFEQIAANLAQLKLNGWDNTSRGKAACWLSDGAGMHPAIFIQNHWCMEIKGRLTVEPKWEFVVAMLQSRLPGFTWKVIEETATKCVVWMKSATEEHTVTYTIEDAVRQGLTTKGNTAWGANDREMLFKQCVKRCGKRIGAAALIDLPIGIEGNEIAVPRTDGDKPKETSAAEVVDGALTDGAQAEPKAKPERATRPDQATAIKALSAALVRKFGRQTKEVALVNATRIYNAMLLKETGVDTQSTFKRVDDIGPNEAERMVVFMESNGITTEPAPTTEPEEQAPAAEETPETEADGQETTPATDGRTPYARLMDTVVRARRVFKDRNFVKEAPPGSLKFWFVDQKILAEAGLPGSTKIRENDALAPGVTVMQIDQLEEILAAACDAEERGGR